jgi:hypothetical protein
MTRTSRLLAALAGTALTVALTATPMTAIADVTTVPTPPTTLPDVPVPPVPELPAPDLPPAPAPAEAPPAPAAASADQPTGPGLPQVTRPPAPELPGLPTSPGSGGGEPAPQQTAASGDGGTSGGGPLGDDVLPADLEAELCTVLTAVLGPLPEQVRGLPATVVDELPAEITDLVPADVLATVTLHCPTVEPAPPGGTATEVRSASTKRVAKAPKQSAPKARKPTGAGTGSLPHTGLVAGIPLAGGALLLTGWALRRAGRARAHEG